MTEPRSGKAADEGTASALDDPKAADAAADASYRRWVVDDDPTGLVELIARANPALARYLRRLRLDPEDADEVSLAVWMRIALDRRQSLTTGQFTRRLFTLANHETQRLLSARGRARLQDDDPALNRDPEDADNETMAAESLATIGPTHPGIGYAEHIGELVTRQLAGLMAIHPDAALGDANMVSQAISSLVVDLHPSPGSEMAELAAPFWSSSRTRDALGGLARSTISERRRTGSILGLPTTDHATFYPVSQFELHDGRIRVRPALRNFFMQLRERDPWTVAVLMNSPAPELDGMTPLEWCRLDNDSDALTRYARAVNAELLR